MILAKLSGSPNSTVSSKVTTPASSSGTSVTSTSLTRRKARNSVIVMSMQRKRAGLKEGAHDGLGRIPE